MGRPYVLLNVAATVDGKIDTVERRGAAISSDADWQRVDALRASVDAVMVGGRTLLDEDPRLTVRSPELRAERIARGVPGNPAKVGVVSQPGQLKKDSRFLKEGAARIILFCPTSTQFDYLEKVEIFHIGEPRVDLRSALATLHDLGMNRVLVEGGGTLNFELLRLGLIDEVQVYVAPRIFGGATAPTLADGTGGLSLGLDLMSAETVADSGVLLRYKVKPS
jgi:2,5-diamino-6-(ribosylamino)-4(3H)-pyrimidinone 5'-phosphate reductase